jgi:LysR family pca operon transcriptional activator
MVIQVEIFGSRIKFRHLHCFLAVAQHHSLQKAAEVLSITQPAVSKTIKELEDILQVHLFVRGRKGAALTREAELFLRHAGTSVSALRQAVDSMAQVRDHGSAMIAIGVLPTLAPSFVPRVLLAFHRAFPEVQVSVITGTNPQLLTQLRQRELDLVLCRLSDPEQMVGLSFEHLYTDPLVLVVRPGHPLLSAPTLELARLRSFTAVLPLKGSVIRHTADTFAITHGIAPIADFIETLSVSFGRAYTGNSDAIWFVPWGAVQPDVESGLLVRLPLSTRGTEESIGVMLRTDGLAQPEVQNLITLFRHTASERRGNA